jgi:hypothetical protein
MIMGDPIGDTLGSEQQIRLSSPRRNAARSRMGHCQTQPRQAADT